MKIRKSSTEVRPWLDDLKRDNDIEILYYRKPNFIAEKTVSIFRVFFNVNVEVIFACFLTLQLKSYAVVTINSGIPPCGPANIDQPADKWALSTEI